MRTVGDRFPAFRCKAVVSNDPADAFVELTEQTHAGQWTVWFFYPKDFTFVCPTELAGFGALDAAFRERGAQLVGGSTDSEFVHLAWRGDHPHLKDLPYPLLSDINRTLSRDLGILGQEEQVCRRATFIVDPEGVIRHASVNDDNVGRNPEEVLRILDALQTGELCGCSWQPGQEPVHVG